MADARTAASVIPTWTVARNLFGSSRNLSRIRARLLPSSISCLTRVLLRVTTAISAEAKRPFKRMKMMMRRMTGHMDFNEEIQDLKSKIYNLGFYILLSASYRFQLN